MGILSISKTFTMDCAHILSKHQGKCANLHGHTYSVSFELTGEQNRESSFVLDYGVLADVVKPIIDFLDHKYLNLFIDYPSAENIALHLLCIFQTLHTVNGDLVISVSETPQTYARAYLSKQNWKRVDQDAYRQLENANGYGFCQTATELNPLYPFDAGWQHRYKQLVRKAVVVIDSVNAQLLQEAAEGEVK